MTNKAIAKLLKLTATLLELHDENQFKIRTYTNAVFNIDKQEELLFEKTKEELEELDGIGKGLAQSIVEIQHSGSFGVLDELLSKTPQGVMEMIDLKGIGPKKIKIIWKELNIESLDQLYDACKQGLLAKLKGFGVKTQETILQNLEYLMSNRGKALFADAEPLADYLVSLMKKAFPDHRMELTGDMRRKMDVVDLVDILIDRTDTDAIRNLLGDDEFIEINDRSSGPYSLRGNFTSIDLKWQIRFTTPQQFHGKMMLSTGSGLHLAGLTKDGKTLHQYLLEQDIDGESFAYKEFGFPYIEPELREGTFEMDFAENGAPPELLELSDLKGPFHNHSNYSDGNNPIRELATYCVDQGYEYLGLSDHSKSAFYADGLREFDIIKQHEEIDRLNQEFAPFRIFKGIESDILNDGSLDYDSDVLASFDFIVASIHSNLNMDQHKATQRLLKAIENPYTTMLGHPTGRLLLKRKAYPIDHKKIIDACAKHKVIIEINANPWRLDLEWQWVYYAVQQGVILSINPDAHEIEGFEDMKYGVYIGRKGGLTKELTFNAWGLDEVEKYLKERKAGIPGSSLSCRQAGVSLGPDKDAPEKSKI